MQHRGPEHAVRLDDVLSDQVDARLPALLPARLVRIAATGQVVDQRIEPDITDVVGIERKFDAPGEALLRPGDAEILEPAALAYHREDFVPVPLRLDEARVRFEVSVQPLEVVAHLEEVVGLVARVRCRLVVAAEPVLQVALGQEALAADAVEPLVLAELDLARVPDLLEDAAHGRRVVRVGRADKAVVGDTEFVPGVAPGLGDAGRVGLDRLARCRSRRLGLLAVLVHAGLEEDRVAGEPVVARHRVGHDRRIGVADVRQAVHVVDRRRQCEGPGHTVPSWSASRARSATIWGLALRWTNDLRHCWSVFHAASRASTSAPCEAASQVVS